MESPFQFDSRDDVNVQNLQTVILVFSGILVIQYIVTTIALWSLFQTVIFDTLFLHFLLSLGCVFIRDISVWIFRIDLQLARYLFSFGFRADSHGLYLIIVPELLTYSGFMMWFVGYGSRFLAQLLFFAPLISTPLLMTSFSMLNHYEILHRDVYELHLTTVLLTGTFAAFSFAIASAVVSLDPVITLLLSALGGGLFTVVYTHYGTLKPEGEA